MEKERKLRWIRNGIYTVLYLGTPLTLGYMAHNIYTKISHIEQETLYSLLNNRLAKELSVVVLGSLAGILLAHQFEKLARRVVIGSPKG